MQVRVWFGAAVALAGVIGMAVGAHGCGRRQTTPGLGSGGSGGPGGEGGTGGRTSTGGSGQTSADASIDTAASPFESQVLAIAAEYQAWGRVDDELRWAPFLCRQPEPGIARPSKSDDSETHGQKLYSVFAKIHDTYPNGPHTGQVVVKESWIPEAATPDGGFHPTAVYDAGDHFYPYARGDGGFFRAAAPAGLFVMFKVDAATADTDQGWVYATVSPAGQVTSAGRVGSCMGCHETAEHDRLFGVPLSPGIP
jgi:hypothetical protein